MTPAEERAMEEKRDRLRQWVPEDRRSSVTQGINHVAVYCKDMDETARFYTEDDGHACDQRHRQP